MLIDAIRLCREKAEEAQKAANALQAGKAETLAGELSFGLLVLEESMREAQYLSLDELKKLCKGSEPKQGNTDTDDDLSDGVSDDDPEKELPHEKKAREEFKDRGYYA